MLQNTWIKYGVSCINIRQVAWEVLKTEAGGRGFQHLPRDLANVNALKNHVRLLLLHKNWKHLLLFALFLALFCFAFSLMSHERYFHGLCSFWGRAVHTSWRQQFCGPGTSTLKVAKPCINSAWIDLLIHGFSPVNARLLITCDTAFYAITCCKYLLQHEKSYFWHVCPTKAQINLSIHTVWSLFIVLMKKIASLAIQMCPGKILIWLHECTGWFESLLGAHVWKYVF